MRKYSVSCIGEYKHDMYFNKLTFKYGIHPNQIINLKFKYNCNEEDIVKIADDTIKENNNEPNNNNNFNIKKFQESKKNLKLIENKLRINSR